MTAQSGNIHRRDLIGSQVLDFDETVDVKRLRRQRLERLQAEIASANLGGLLLFDPVNVRYAAGVRSNDILATRLKFGYEVVVPREGKTVLFGVSGNEPAVLEGTVNGRGLDNFDFWLTGPFNREATRSWARVIKAALEELGIGSEPIGFDGADPRTTHALEAEGILLEDALEPLSMARAIKTQDELALIRQSCAVADIALSELREAVRPGVTENKLFAILTYANLRHNGERMDCKLLASGGNTNPWAKRTSTPRMVKHGDLVSVDTDMAGPLGYFADFSRCYLCGDGVPTKEQLEAYRLAYDFLINSIPLFTVVATFEEIARNAPEVPDVYKANRYGLIGHGVGMSDEWPAIFFSDMDLTGYGNYPGELQENMVMTVESSFGREGGHEQVIITADGPEVISHAPFDWRFLS